jgi:hypothetical protein
MATDFLDAVQDDANRSSAILTGHSPARQRPIPECAQRCAAPIPTGV